MISISEYLSAATQETNGCYPYYRRESIHNGSSGKSNVIRRNMIVRTFYALATLVTAQIIRSSFMADFSNNFSNQCYAYRTGTSFQLLRRRHVRFTKRSFTSPISLLEPLKPVHGTTMLSMSMINLPKVIVTLPEQYKQVTSTKIVPTTMSEALATFFLSKDIHGPRLVVVLLLGFILQRVQIGWTGNMAPWDDIGVAFSVILFWLLQEHVMHKYLLHSNFNWIGKCIHQEHHERPYHHVSIDPAPLIVGWFAVVHLLLRYVLMLPPHLALTTTIAYGIAGLFYEWTHYIVHTRVRFRHGSYWEHVKNHHARHHLVNNNHWFAFSLTQIDDIFGTNPKVSEVSKSRVFKELK
jgi:hypothetical protein